MPIPVPFGACPQAFRFMCIRVVRAYARGSFLTGFGFNNLASMKCAYCTSQNAGCFPVISELSDEFAVFVNALEDYAMSSEVDASEEDLDIAKQRVIDSAQVLSDLTLTISALEKVALADADRLAVLRDQCMRDIVGHLAVTRQELVAMRATMRITVPATPVRVRPRGAAGGPIVGPATPVGETAADAGL